MLEALYSLTIYPLELIMRLLLEGVYYTCASYGFSLIVLSVLVSLGTTPLYQLADRWQKAEKALQEKMKGRLQDFKGVFSGYELHAYIKTLHRQNNYNPFLAIRSSFGLLIQIPFFIAAYQLLSHYVPLTGTSFLFIKDLAQADRLIPTPWGTINALPFVMTIANLASAYIYGKNISFQDNVKTYGIALCFLVFLYASPSGLLIYWTVNNIFSLVRNYFNNARGEREQITQVERVDGYWLQMIAQYYTTRPPFWSCLIIIGLSFVGYSLFVNERLGTSGSHFHGLLLNIVLITILNSYLFCGFALRVSKSYIVTALKFVLLFILLVGPFLSIYALAQSEKSSFDLQFWSLVLVNGLCVFFVFVRVFSALVRVSNSVFSQKISNGESTALYFLGTILSVLLVVLVAPISLMASGDAHDFPLAEFVYLRPLLATFSIFLLCAFIVKLIVPSSVLRLLGLGLSLLSILIMANQFIFMGDFGDMSNFIFEHGVVNDAVKVIANVLGLITIAFIYAVLLIKKRVQWINKFLWASGISALFLVGWDTLTFFDKKEGLVQDQKDQIEPVYTFSKDGKNVVVLIMDRLIGGHIPKAFELMPELKESLDGFYWYPKSLSGGSCTIAGVPAILGGYDYSLKSIQESRSHVSLKDKIDESYRVLPYNFGKAGFESTFIDPNPRLFNSKNTQYIENVAMKRPGGLYDDLWMSQNNQSSIKVNTPLKLIMFGLFRSAPSVLQSWVYDQGQWLLPESNSSLVVRDKIPNTTSFTPSNSQKKATLKSWAVMDYLPELSRVESGGTNRFYFMHNILVHEPWSIGPDMMLDVGGEIQYPNSIVDFFGGSLFSAKHFYATAASLKLIADWIKWLKDNGVYDNTRIIIVSDHGYNVHNPMFNQQKVPLSEGEVRSGKNSLSKYEMGWFHIGLLSKDFSARGELTIDSSFKTASDVPAMALNGIIQGVNPYTDKLIKEPDNKFPYKNAHVHWQVQSHEFNKFNIGQSYTVYNDDIFDVKNWRGGELLDIEFARLNNLPLGHTVNISEVNTQVSNGSDFTFKLKASHSATVSVRIRSDQDKSKSKLVNPIQVDGLYTIKSEQFFIGVNSVEVIVVLDEGAYKTSKQFPVFYSDGTKRLLEASELSGKQGWGKIGHNKSAGGVKLSVAKQLFSWGFGTHSDSDYTFNAKGQYSTLTISFGMSDYANCGDGFSIFKILLDGKVALKKTIKRGELGLNKLDVSGVDIIEFETRKGKNSQCDHTNWLNPLLTVKEASEI